MAGLVVLGLGLVALPGCQDDSTYHGKSSEGGLVGGFAASFDMGEAAYKLLRARLDGPDATAQARVAALDARKAEFQGAINTVLTPQSLQGLGPTLHALLGLIDDGTLPRMTDNLADVLESLVNEPNHTTVRAFLELAEARKVLQARDGLRFVGQLVSYPEVDRVMGALAELIRQNDGRDDQGNPNGEPDLVDQLLRAASALLSRAAAPTTGQAGAGAALVGAVVEDLLAPAPPRTPGAFGAPAWIVLADLHGNPSVFTDPATGTLVLPFVDADGDGAADVDADGDPVDASGAKVDIPAFETPGIPGYDTEGRAVAANGLPLYRYLDAKETMLSHGLQLVGEAMRRGVTADAVTVAEVALGARVRYDAGTPTDPSDDYDGFARDNAVHDLAWGALQLLRLDHVPAVLRSVAELLRADPALSERVFVAVGKAVERLRPILLAPQTAPELASSRAAIDRAVRLLDRIMQTGGGGQRSAGRVLVDVLARLGQSGRELPGELALMLRYRKLVLDANGNPATGSERVDRSAPARVGNAAAGVVENRSILHQLLDLLGDADACTVLGQPLAETILELMAGRSVGTVNTVIGLTGSGVVRALVTAVCPGIGDDLDALEGLRQSGALDALLPLAAAFVDEGETRLLVEALKAARQDYATLLRPYEDVAADVLDSGVGDAVFDLVELLATGRGGQPVTDPRTGERVLDVLADGLAELVRHPVAGVPDARGTLLASPLHLVLAPSRRVEDAVRAAGNTQAVATGLTYNLTDLLTERAWNDAGTPSDPSDDFEQLANPNLVPFVTRVLREAAASLPAATVDRWQVVADLQTGLTAAVTSREAAVVLDVLVTVRGAQGVDVFKRATLNLLTPDPLAPDDAFGSLLRLLVSGLQARVDTAPLRDIAAFAAGLLDPANGRIADIVEGAGRLVVADSGQLIVRVLRNALVAAPAGAPIARGDIPAELLLDILEDIQRAGGSAAGGAQASQLQDVLDAIQALVDLMRDDVDGLGWFYDLVRNRGR
jgi:hypothetical protein